MPLTRGLSCRSEPRRLSHSRGVATYIIASNARRHMSKGQQAIAVAMMHPEPAKTKRKGSGSLEPKELGISGARIYSAASAGVSLTFINPASSVVLGYDLDLGSSGKLDFRRHGGA